MDWLTFTSKALDALAWPLASIALVALLRKELQKLAPQLKKVKAGPLEAEFEREVKEVKANAAPTQSEQRTGTPDVASKAFLLHLAEMHPRSAIQEAWVRVEAAARTALGSKDKPSELRSYVSAARLAEPLAEQGLLTHGQVTLFHELRRLRNEVAHQSNLEPSTESVKSYIEMSSYLQGWLENAAKQ
jgi:hypothetical protein